MASSAIAACAVRGNSIYIYYQSNKNPSSYPLSVLSAQPSSQSSGSNVGSPTATPGPINSYFPSSLSQTNTFGQYDDATTTVSKSNDNKKILATDSDIAPAAPSNGASGVNSTLYVQLLSIINSGSNLASLGSQASSLSMVSMNTYRHDLLLAFNGRGGSMMSGSALVRMIPQSPSTGNGLDSLSGLPWTFETTQQPLLPYGATTQLWLATPSGSTADQASLVYDMFTSQNKAGLQLGMLDINGGRVSVLSNVIPIQSDGDPVLVHLESSTSLLNYSMAIIGVSSTAPTLSTGIYFSSDDGILFANKMLAGVYDPTACYTNADGLLIKATPQTIQTISYTGGINVVEWSIRQSPNTLVLPSSVLACTTVGNTLYAVVEGDSNGVPKIYTADITPNNDWTWRSRKLYISNFSSGGNSNPDNVSRSSSGLSTGAMAGIVVVVIVVVGGAIAWFFMRHRRRSPGNSKHAGGVDKITVRPPPPAPVVAPALGAVPGAVQQQQYLPPYAGPPPPGSVSMSPPMNYHQQQVPTSSGAGWTTAMYPSPSQPGEYIPMVASSLTTAPPAPLSHHMYSSAGSSIPSTPVYSTASPTIVGDKQELTSEDTTIVPASSAVSHHQRPSTAMSHNSHLEGSSNTLLGASSHPARSDSRMQEMFSPALANAQLILQRSQSPPNQTYQELQQPYHR